MTKVREFVLAGSHGKALRKASSELPVCYKGSEETNLNSHTIPLYLFSWILCIVNDMEHKEVK